MKRFILVLLLLLLPMTSHAKDISLTWDATPSPHTGYRVHYDCDSGVPPFDGTDALQSSPIDVGMVTAVTVLGFLDSAGCWFAVTAYNEWGFESEYSNIVYGEPLFGNPNNPTNTRGNQKWKNKDIPLTSAP